jgi:hypothetical protein
MKNEKFNRRNFLESSLGLTAFGAGALVLPRNGYANMLPEDRNINLIGPIEGYAPQIGTLITMLDWLSNSVVSYNKKMTVEQLDYIHDKDSNSIGSLMMHLAATEVIYQDITFHNLEDFTKENKAKWNVAMNLEEDARKEIKGNPLSYYKDAMNEVRAKTKAEMKTRDDKWFLSGETKDWDWNNYCKWFHVAEHFANHRGQMTWYAKRLPK